MTATSDSQKAPGFRREIPPRINPDTEDMIKQIRKGYEAVTGHLTSLEGEFGRLVDSELIDPEDGRGLQQDCLQLYEVLYENTEGAIRAWDGVDPHFIADRAKYCYAVLMYQLAQMQYYVGELATLGRLDRKANHDLQWEWFGGTGEITQDLWAGIVEATVDWSIDGGGFHTGFYGDGRMVVTDIVLQLPRDGFDAIWPHDNDDLSDGPIWRHPRATVCHIEPPEPQDKGFPDRAIKVDISRMLQAYAAANIAQHRLITETSAPSHPRNEGTRMTIDSPLPACRRCKKSSADSLDGMCTPCRAENACTTLTRNLTETLEIFLDDPVVAAPLRRRTALLLPRRAGVRRRLGVRRDHGGLRPDRGGSTATHRVGDRPAGGDVGRRRLRRSTRHGDLCRDRLGAQGRGRDATMSHTIIAVVTATSSTASHVQHVRRCPPLFSLTAYKASACRDTSSEIVGPRRSTISEGNRPGEGASVEP